ncbi:DUF421 domain-containing protein [Paenibacillus zeisoli]|uniref:DUF421 domain-containing protein n=1 Tax=Paenibacillus zeisoli TaxID=2496267 RepID=A0A3S1D2U7_9BACL|nr:YetF domain-containing protein [Paenibacillus zeisoli]RUT35716.1 DUF421 domain-containing protein [Paenibacillus zeisoli]
MWTVFWNSIVLAIAGTLFLRIAGRNSISEMTTPQVTILLMVGTVLGSEIGGKGLGMSVFGTFILVLFLVASEWISLRFNRAEKLLKGFGTPVISEGKMLIENMKKLRISVDDLEKRLRLLGISRIEDVKTGTIEENGQFGYELYRHARPVTMEDLEQLLKANFPHIVIPAESSEDNIFSETFKDSGKSDQPKYLQ